MGEIKVLIIPYTSFKEKIRLTKKYDRKGKMEIVDDKYVYVERLEEEDEN